MSLCYLIGKGGYGLIQLDSSNVRGKRLCVDSPNRRKVGSRTHMIPCNDQNINQLWVYNKKSGQIRGKGGLCLAGNLQGQVHIRACRLCDENQQWTYSANSGQLKHKYGKCLDSPSLKQVRARPYLHNCDVHNKNQQWTYKGLVQTGEHILLNAGYSLSYLTCCS